jgi:hypothetical protein
VCLRSKTKLTSLARSIASSHASDADHRLVDLVRDHVLVATLLRPARVCVQSIKALAAALLIGMIGRRCGLEYRGSISIRLRRRRVVSLMGWHWRWLLDGVGIGIGIGKRFVIAGAGITGYDPAHDENDRVLRRHVLWLGRSSKLQHSPSCSARGIEPF